MVWDRPETRIQNSQFCLRHSRLSKVYRRVPQLKVSKLRLLASSCLSLRQMFPFNTSRITERDIMKFNTRSSCKVCQHILIGWFDKPDTFNVMNIKLKDIFLYEYQ